MRYKLCFLVVVAALFPLTIHASENIRVLIADDQREVVLISSDGLMVKGAASKNHAKKLVFGQKSIKNRPVGVRAVNGIIAVNGKTYRGAVELRKKQNGRILVINDLDIEDYLKGVIASEVPQNWEFEALKAQAVAARTYALYQKRSAGNRFYHVLATVSSQVYNGSSGERSNAVRAVLETRGIVLVYQGKVIPAFFHANCGGHTEDAAELWGIDAPYLKGVDCECQDIVVNGLWEKRVGLPRITGVMRQLGFRLNEISGMSIGAITPAGRVKEVVVWSEGMTSTVPSETLRAALGNTEIPSVFFELELSDGEAVFSGRGSGHGVGLCQWGAKEMAQRGFDYRAILFHYYPGTVLNSSQ
jgi:stage II sporulation protein D